MKISENWLREWANPAITGEQLIADITMAGLEVDGRESAAAQFSGVVVAKIQSIAAHPDAEKLRVCQVFDGESVQQVVCGASNAAEGLLIPFAQLGAVLPGDFKIKKAKLRGVESFGMLCSASELGLEDKIDGLLELPSDAPVGTDLRSYLQLDDFIIEVDLTPNRGDCLSTQGLAREVAVLHDIALTEQAIPAVAAQSASVFPVRIDAQEACPIYVGRVIENIDITAPTPLWMQEKLRRGGIRSIDAVVDITNYVMLELGQPLHAFDKAQLVDGIVVRKAKADEGLQLLDGQALKLKADTLVISDAEKALALAGIMGGKHSGVSETTKDIVLEAAFFAPLNLAGCARGYGLHTDSSHRFERGVDWQGQVRAIERASALLLEIVGGVAGPLNIQETAYKPTQKTVTLSQKRLAQVLGLSLDKALVTQILQRLGFVVEQTADVWQCLVPSWRFDIAIEADLIEEIARVYGYNNLPTRQLTVPVDFVPRKEAQRPLAAIRQTLVASGYQEAITYSFIEPSLHALFSDIDAVRVQNPISTDMSVMRTSLLPGLVNAMLSNRKRQQSRIRLFETGLNFVQTEQGLQQTPMIAGLIYGERFSESWHGAEGNVDFYDIKGDVENLLSLCGHNDVRFVKAEHKALHPGQAANVVLSDGQSLGVFGALHPQLCKALDIVGSAYVFEFALNTLTVGDVPAFRVLSKFPQTRRDLALIIDTTVNAGDLLQAIRTQVGDLLTQSFVFDVYQGKGIEEGKKSLALALIFQHAERSLQDSEVQGIVDKLLTHITKEFGALLRN